MLQAKRPEFASWEENFWFRCLSFSSHLDLKPSPQTSVFPKGRGNGPKLCIFKTNATIIILIISKSAASLRSNGPNSWISGKAK
jgi:hypothetical protein